MPAARRHRFMISCAPGRRRRPGCARGRSELVVRVVVDVEDARGDELRERREPLRVGEHGQHPGVGGHPLVRGDAGRPDGRLDVGFRGGQVPDVAADQHDHGRLLRLGQIAVAQAAETLLEPGDLVGHDRQPAEGDAHQPRVPPVAGPHRPGPPRQRVPPAQLRRHRGRRRPVRGVDHEADQLVLGVHVPVQGHRRRRRARRRPGSWRPRPARRRRRPGSRRRRCAPGSAPAWAPCPGGPARPRRPRCCRAAPRPRHRPARDRAAVIGHGSLFQVDTRRHYCVYLTQ